MYSKILYSTKRPNKSNFVPLDYHR